MPGLRSMAMAAVLVLALGACGGDDTIDFSAPSTGADAVALAEQGGTDDPEVGTSAGDDGGADPGAGAGAGDSATSDPTAADDGATTTEATGDSDSGDGTEPRAETENPTTTGGGDAADVEPEIRFLVPLVHAEYPHDPAAYTQGLEFHDGLLLESTGLRGESSIRRTDPETGEVLSILSVDDELFAEGLTRVGDELLQLTWQAETLIVRDVETLTERRRLSYRGEGWGVCDDGSRLVMSNGSSVLTFRDRTTFEPIGSVDVTFRGQSVVDLNELECVGDRVWANVWKNTAILSIDPASGVVDAVVDASALVPAELVGHNEDVLNGIAHHPDTGRFWVTGKRWPVMYEVSFVEG